MSAPVDEGSSALMGCYMANGRGERERERALKGRGKRVLATHAIRRTSIPSTARGQANKNVSASLTCTEFQPIKETTSRR